MNREFLDLYNRELGVLQQQAKEFADEYPGIAERLGGLIEDRSDPMIVGLLEGAAFLAARVQLKMKHEFPEFVTNLLEQLVPNYLAPTPSAMLARFRPNYGDPALREGRRIERGSLLDATYRERERRVACRYRTTGEVTLWPFDIVAADYLGHAGQVGALVPGCGPEIVAGLRLTLTHRSAAKRDDEMTDPEAARHPALWFAGCPMEDLPVQLVGPEADAVAIYEQVIANRVGIYLRYMDEFGDPVVLRAPADAITSVGWEVEERLLPKDQRVFDGFDLLREYFIFPRKFLGFRLGEVARMMSRVPAKTVEIIFTLNEVNGRLSAAVEAEAFALYAAPAVNLFEMSTDRVPVQQRQHEYHLIPDRSRYLEFEPHRLLEVYAHLPGRPDKVPVRPLYAVEGDGSRHGLFYTTRRVPRRRTDREHMYGASSDYTGTDIFISIGEPGGIDSEQEVAELSVRALCSNRHLPEQLPVGESGADFRLADDVTLNVSCAAGPTRPREPVVANLRSRTESAFTGEVAWRLVSLLSLNHLGLVQRGAGGGGQALREIMTLFADFSDNAVERRIRGVRSVESRPVNRRLRQRTGTGTARGSEVTLTLDEKAFEGTGAFLLGAVLDRFFAEYAGMNHFTQLVLRTVERGEIHRFQPRAGLRPLL